jgi:hypothetical protein
MKLNEKGVIKMEVEKQKGLNRAEIEVLILAVIILASGLSFLILNFGLLAK